VSTYDVLVIGEGISGLTAAQSLAQSGLRVATLEAQLFGGLVININELDPPPGEGPASGAEFASELMQANAERGVTSIQEPVTAIREAGAMKEVVTGENTYEARHVIVASGARIRRLGVPGEADFEGRGVSQCGDCDGPMYQNEHAVVVGGGDSALQEALVLAQYCSKVTIVHRGASFRARPHFVAHVEGNSKITTLWNTTVAEIAGTQMVESVLLKQADGATQRVSCAGVFAYPGLEPNAAFLPAAVVRDAAGCAVTSDTLETAVPGIYAIGAVRSGHGGTLKDAIGEARRVAATICGRA